MAARIYELCSGKLTIEEIVEAVRKNNDVLPPVPIVTEQVIDILKQMEDRFMIVFGDT